MNHIAWFQRVQLLGLCQIPQNCRPILHPNNSTHLLQNQSDFATGCAQRSIRGNRNRIDVAGVPCQVTLPSTRCEIPHFNLNHVIHSNQDTRSHFLIPSTRHHHRHRLIRGEAHTRHPICMSILLWSKFHFAFPQRIPNADRLVP